MSKVETELHMRPDFALESCESQQIHIPGTIQSFGSLIAFDRDHVVTRASENIEREFGISAAEIIGRTVKDIFNLSDAEKLMRSATEKRPQSLLRLRNKNDKEVYALAHYLGDEYYLDLLEHGDSFDPLAAVQQFVSAIAAANTQIQCAQIIAQEIFRISKFDRVKVYKFDADWNGEVIAEARHHNVPSYKGLHFPESDIPKQARGTLSTQ